MAIQLSFDTGGLAGTNIVTAAKFIRFGRDPQASDIVLTAPMVSRRHAAIEKSVLGAYTLTVLGAGPTTFNGDPIVLLNNRPSAHVLASGDRVDFGGVQIRFAEAEIKLICVAGPAVGRELVLTDHAMIGSDGECALVLDDPTVAPEHLEIEVTVFGFKVIVHEPVTINGAPAANRMLTHGDEIQLGSSTLRCIVSVAGERSEEADENAPVPAVKSNAVGELVFIAGAAKGERLLLGDEQIILGTRDDCTRILNDALASPLHCAISKADERFIATDIGSQSGTLINGERITQGTPLSPGDLLTVGTHVLEARLLGGVKQAIRAKTSFLTFAGELGGPLSRFVIDGRVVKAKRIAIGRAPACDVLVEDTFVSREHCVIEWQGATFTVRDSSTHGTYVDDKRVVRHPLEGSCVLRVGNTMFRITVRGQVCTIERADAALAQAAVDVARQQAALVSVPPQQQQQQQPGNAMRTVFHMDGAQLEHEIAARKKDLKRGAPAWRPSSDLAREGALRWAIVIAMIGALAVGCVSIGLRGGDALVDHPVSAAHSSPAFTAKRTGTTPCSSCHTAGARVDESRCTSCHSKFAARAEHHALDCGSCHREHQDAPAHTALGARGTCDGCHHAQHAKEFAGEGAPQKLAAGPLPASTPAFVGVAPDAASVVALHAAHSKVTIGGKVVGVACTGCHATQAAGKLADAKAGLSCFRCHARTAANTCDTCHGHEHGASGLTPVVSAAPVTTHAGPHPVTSVAWALGFGAAGGAPTLLFGLVLRTRRRRRGSALVEKLKAHPAEVVKRLVHSINDSKCVGCGLCVQACPASVLELVDHKSRVVNFDSCIQCKRCESACAFDALRMHDADKPPPMIPMPSIDAFHETPVAGMFLIGQASGTPQVKNATNLGRAAIQRILQQGFRPGDGRALGCDVDVAIIGSGPAGLSSALTAIEAGLSYVVLEKEREFSWTIRNYYHKGKEVMAEPNDVDLEATLPHWDSSREELLGAWNELVANNRVDIRYQHDVVDIKKDGQRFVVSLGDPRGKPIGAISAARVVLAIGTLGNPRKLGCPGDDLQKVKNSLVDPDEWQGKSILVVGGSDSAVEVVLALCKPERRNKVYFSTRGAKLEGIKPKNRKLIEDALAAGQYEIRYATTVAEVTPTGVALSYKEDGRREDLPNDVVFAMVGGNSPQKWLQQLGIPYVDKPHNWSPPRTDMLARKTAEGLVQLRRLPRRAVPVKPSHH